MRWISLLLASGCGSSTYYPVVPYGIDTAEGTDIPCSTPYGNPVSLQIVSTILAPLQVGQVDVTTCALAFYAELGPQAVLDISTTSEVTWVVSDNNGAVLTVIRIPFGSTTWTVEVP